MAGLLGGRYQLTSLLGGGQTGDVWLARDRGTGREVAVKVFHPHLAADARLADRFLRAKGVLTGLWHPGIARVLDVVAEQDNLALVMELAPGVDLQRRLYRMGPLAPGQAAEVAAIAADALAAAHRVGVVHGDLKPSNVLLADPSGGSAQVTDFSVALFVRAGKQRSEESAYTAPDVIDGAVPGASSDVYSLGLLLCEMVTGSADLSEVGPAELGELIHIVDECVRRNPAARPQAHEVHDRLLAVLGDTAVSRPPATTASRPAATVPSAQHRLSAPVHAARPRRWIAVAALSLAAVVAVTAMIMLRDPGSGPSAQPGPGVATTANPGTPTLPVAASAATQQGGMAFVEYWFSLFTHAVRAGDTSTLESVTNPGCAECRRALEAIRAGHSEGGSMLGGAYLVRAIRTNNLWTTERPIYDVTIDRSARTSVDRSGATRATLAGLSFAACILVLEWVNERWRVLEVLTPGCVG